MHFIETSSAGLRPDVRPQLISSVYEDDGNCLLNSELVAIIAR